MTISSVPSAPRHVYRAGESSKAPEARVAPKDSPVVSALRPTNDVDESVHASRHIEVAHPREIHEGKVDRTPIYRPPGIDAINPQQQPPEITHTPPTAPFYILTPQGPATYYWREFFDGVARARRERRLRHLFVKYPVFPGDVQQQVQLLKEMLDESPSGIAISLPQIEPFMRLLERARSDYVPILLLNSAPHHEADPLADFKFPFVSVDHYLAGQLAAAKSKRLGYVPARTLVLDYAPDHVSQALRYQGIYDVLSADGPVDLLTLPVEPDEALALLKQTWKDDVSGVFCLGAPVLRMVGQWLGNTVKDSDYRIFAASFDRSPLTEIMVQRQVLRFSVDLSPFRQGELCADNTQQTFRLRPTIIEFDPSKGGVIQDRSL